MTDKPIDQRWEILTCAAFAGVFLSFIYLYATAPISDVDFWWHLKSGEVMFQNGWLLQSDPFNFTGDGVVSNRESLILKGYWLWQISAYVLYRLLGFNGIFLLNLLVLGATAGVVILEMRRQQVNSVLVILLTSLGFYLFSASYNLDRPQIVSFLWMAILVGQLARARDGGQLGWPLPLLMMLWANLHGGFVVGDLVLLCFAGGVMIEYRQDLPRLRHLLLWVAIAIVASLLNPNGALVFGELFSFHNSDFMGEIYDYQSTWLKFQGGDWYFAVLWLLIFLYGLGLWLTRWSYWPDLIVALFLACFAAAYIRNVAFFAIALLPSIGFYLQYGLQQRSWNIPPLVKYVIILLSAGLLLWQAGRFWEKQNREGSVISFYPEKLSQFIQTSGLQGRMYNNYNFGGYFIWQLYPQQRVFIDTRGLDEDVYRDWKLITSASLTERGGRKEFEVLLDQYEIDYVVQPLTYTDTGRLTPLLKFLQIKSEWIPIYVDHDNYILVRSSERNRQVIDRYRIDKREFSNKIIGYLTASCRGNPEKVVNHIALGEMLIFVGRYTEAEEPLAMIARLQPDNLNLVSLRKQLETLRSKRN